ncbi:MAG: hypothetical protein JSU77_13120 [Fidelibacterota bacterium]|nr:MAG: hypothetical protein JSU77_13120 [Candidatus Neomarinimicrobiota bacterium]
MQRSLTKLHRSFLPILLILTSSLLGQLKSDLPLVTPASPLKSIASPSWFDPQRFSMTHGFSISLLSGSGLGPGASSLSVYTNQMRYLIASNVLLSSRIDLVQPGTMGALQPGGNNLQIFYQAGLDWQPFRSVKVHLGISNLPPMRYYYPYYRPMHRQMQNRQAPNHPDNMEP